MENDKMTVTHESDTKKEAGQSKKPFYKKWWFWLIIAIVILALIGAIAGGTASGTDTDGDTTSVGGNTNSDSDTTGNGDGATSSAEEATIGDPVSNKAVLAEKLYKFYLQKGLDVSYKVYPGARHEILNEINKKEVYADMLAFIEARFAR